MLISVADKASNFTTAPTFSVVARHREHEGKQIPWGGANSSKMMEIVSLFK